MTDMEMAAQLVGNLDSHITALRSLYRDLNARYEAQESDDTAEGKLAAGVLKQADRLAKRLTSLG